MIVELGVVLCINNPNTGVLEKGSQVQGQPPRLHSEKSKTNSPLSLKGLFWPISDDENFM